MTVVVLVYSIMHSCRCLTFGEICCFNLQACGFILQSIAVLIIIKC